MTTAQKFSYFGLLLITSVLFVFAGYSKVSGMQAAAEGFQMAHLPIWLMYFVGTCEILGAIALWFGVSSNKTMRALSTWAAYGLFIILAGAVVTTALFASVGEAIFPLLVGVILSVLVWLGNKRAALRSVAPSA